MLGAVVFRKGSPGHNLILTSHGQRTHDRPLWLTANTAYGPSAKGTAFQIPASQPAHGCG